MLEWCFQGGPCVLLNRRFVDLVKDILVMFVAFPFAMPGRCVFMCMPHSSQRCHYPALVKYPGRQTRLWTILFWIKLTCLAKPLLGRVWRINHPVVCRLLNSTRTAGSDETEGHEMQATQCFCYSIANRYTGKINSLRRRPQEIPHVNGTKALDIQVT